MYTNKVIIASIMLLLLSCSSSYKFKVRDQVTVDDICTGEILDMTRGGWFYCKNIYKVEVDCPFRYGTMIVPEEFMKLRDSR